MNSGAPTLSIIVPSIEPPEILGPHLRALRERTGGDCELIVVGQAHGLSEENVLGLGFRRGRVIEGQDRSHAHAINLGMIAATGRALVWMNADDLPTPALLQAARTCADGQVFVYGEALRRHSDGSSSPYGVPASIDLRSLAAWCPIAQPACLIPSSALAKVGVLDAGLRLGFDYEYWIRAIKAGMRFEFANDLLAEVAIRPDAKSFRLRPEVFVDEAEIQRRHFGCERPAIYEAYWSECGRPAFGYESVRRVLLDSARDVFRAEMSRSLSARRIINTDARMRLLAQGLRADVHPNASLPPSSRLWVSGQAAAVTLWLRAPAGDVALLTDGGLVEARPAAPGAARVTWRPQQGLEPASAQLLIGQGVVELSAIAIQWSQAPANGSAGA